MKISTDLCTGREEVEGTAGEAHVGKALSLEGLVLFTDDRRGTGGTEQTGKGLEPDSRGLWVAN